MNSASTFMIPARTETTSSNRFCCSQRLYSRVAGGIATIVRHVEQVADPALRQRRTMALDHRDAEAGAVPADQLVEVDIDLRQEQAVIRWRRA